MKTKFNEFINEYNYMSIDDEEYLYTLKEVADKIISDNDIDDLYSVTLYSLVKDALENTFGYVRDDDNSWVIHYIWQNRPELKESKNEKKGKCPESGCVKKVGNKWRVISNKYGKLWPAHYDSKEDAENALKAYHVHK